MPLLPWREGAEDPGSIQSFVAFNVAMATVLLPAAAIWFGITWLMGGDYGIVVWLIAASVVCNGIGAGIWVWQERRQFWRLLRGRARRRRLREAEFRR